MLNTLEMEKSEKSRGVLNIPEELKSRFTDWCEARELKIKSVIADLVTWFLDQDEVVQNFVRLGPTAYPEKTREASVEAIAEMIIQRAEEKAAAHKLAAPLSDTSSTQDELEDGAASRGRSRRQRRAS